MVKLTDQQISDMMNDLGAHAKTASLQLANAPTDQKNLALRAAAKLIEENIQEILRANDEDVNRVMQKISDAQRILNQPTGNTPEQIQSAEKLLNRYNDAYVNRLTLGEDGVKGIVAGLRKIETLPDPVGRILGKLAPANEQLAITRVAVPLGVIGIIYESRPNVTADAGALCLKSGNATILRGGSDSLRSSKAIVKYLKAGLEEAKLNPNCIQLIETDNRAAVDKLLTMSDTVDVIVPRGGKSLVSLIQQKSKIPVFSHLEGINHIFLDKETDFKKAYKVIFDSKLRRTGVCGALETLLIHEDVASTVGLKVIKSLLNANCEVRGDDAVHRLFATETVPSGLKKAAPHDWSTEYLAPILSVRVVPDLDEAMAHINQYGSGHTDCIITENQENADRFLQEVDSAIVVHNASTQFADGGEFGMGAEIGISTGRMHARGPVGLEQLTTFKYWVVGAGTTRANYALNDDGTIRSKI